MNEGKPPSLQTLGFTLSHRPWSPLPSRRHLCVPDPPYVRIPDPSKFVAVLFAIVRCRAPSPSSVLSNMVDAVLLIFHSLFV
ncbi:hypothetical protein PIB30_041351 [Stylosanthes scabra]|uniref:Uncharacterized protein n=1 Tax=Stylosanthes scabra TaxID=79078 RepID=A0ABU6YGU1_9FABA|nr:hypothetical protein [Stylosanthes scabra]